MARSRGRRKGPVQWEWALLVGLALWALVPLALMAVHAVSSHERLTGADGPIAPDQLQYLAWARDAGSHGLSANLFNLPVSAHVYAMPLSTVSGALWRIGLPLQLAYLLWKPVAIVALFIGAAALARRMFPGQPDASAATIAVGLFFVTPLAWIAGWPSLGGPVTRAGLLQLAGEMFPAGSLWGYLPIAIAIALMPVALLAAERATLAPSVSQARGPLALAAGAALVSSWLHPWQGLTLVLILVGLAVWGRGRHWATLAVPSAAALLPLVYYVLLARYDSAWHLASHNELASHLSAKVLVAGLLPPLLLASTGMRRPGADFMEKALLLWLVASFAAYFALNSFPAHSLEGLSFPLAVLMVRGWRRIGLPTVVSLLALGIATLPALAYEAHLFREAARSPSQVYYLTSSEARALDWVAHDAPPGAVLSNVAFAIVVPSQTDRAVWVGHQYWSRDFDTRSRLADELLDGKLNAPAAQRVVRESGARLVVSDCRHRADLTPALRPLIQSVHRFGCAVVYVVNA